MNSNAYMNIHSIQLHIDELKPLYEYSFNPITYEYSFNPITYR